MSKLIIYKKDDLYNKEKRDIIIAHNAFILTNGDFILANGYDARRANHLVEKSANDISRFLIKKTNLLEQYRNYLKDNKDKTAFYYLREVLIHYYGMALFADTDSLDITRHCDMKFDHFIIPNSSFFKKRVTDEQVETIKDLIKINGEDLQGFDAFQKLKK